MNNDELRLILEESGVESNKIDEIINSIELRKNPIDLEIKALEDLIAREKTAKESDALKQKIKETEDWKEKAILGAEIVKNGLGVDKI